MTATFPRPIEIDHVELREEELREDLSDGQRIDAHEVLLDGRPLASGRTVGIRRWHAFPAATGSRLTVRLDDGEARPAAVTAFHTGHETIPELEPQPSAEPANFEPDAR